MSAFCWGGKDKCSKREKTKFQEDLRRYLREDGVDHKLIHLICEIAEASKYIVNSIRTGDLGVAGTSYLEENGAKLRYSGGLVLDINQMLIKGNGMFLYPHL